MRTAFALFVLVILPLAMSGCSSSSDSPTAPPPTETPAASGTVGSGGGEVAGDEVILEVPAGALTGDTDLAIYEKDGLDPFEGETGSPVFQVQGLPENHAAPITFKVMHGGADPDSLFGLIGLETWIPSRGETAVTWTVADCRDSLGWAVFTLPPADVPGGKAAPAPVLVTTVKGVSSLETSDGHFRLYWSPRMATTDQVVALRGYMEESMALYDLMGFEQTGFDAWPVRVLVKPLDWFGHWAPSSRRLGGHLAFSTRYIHDDVEIRLTAGHELLHFCQYFYDPRTIRERGTDACPHSWLSEATAVYIEDYFADDPEYCSSARGGRELTALDGIVTASGRTLAEHGYGQSSLIRYLAETEGDDFILKAYQSIRTGTHAVAALQAVTTTDLQDVWQDLLTELVRGRIYNDVTMDVLLRYPASTLLNIAGPADSTATEALLYPDLSGQTWYVQWDAGMNFTDNQRLVFWCDGPEYGLSVVGLRGPDTRDLLGQAYGKIMLTNPASLKENYEALLVLVGNHQLEGPSYDGTTELALQARLRETENFGRYDHAAIRIQYEADWSTSTSNTYSQEMNFAEVEGTFNGTTFSAAWDSTGFQGVQYSGHITVTLDPATLKATSWSARNYAVAEDGSWKDFQASGSALPDVQYNSSWLDTRVEGEATCNSLGSLSVRFVDSAGETTRSLDGWTCNPTSYVKVLLYNRNPD